MNATLQTGGITWDIVGKGRKASYQYNSMVSVSYRHQLGMYVISVFGNDLFRHTCPVVCLERATEDILSYHAAQYQPMWDVV